MANIRIILHGKACANARLTAAVHRAREQGHGVEVRVTWETGDAERLTAVAVREAVDGRIDCIIAGGGDGTINAVFGAAYSAGLPPTCSLGILPLGTANDFARSADIPAGDLAAALRIAANTAPRPIDVGLINGRLFVNLVSGGFVEGWSVFNTPRDTALSLIFVGLQYFGPGMIKTVMTLRTGNAWVHAIGYHVIAPHVVVDTPLIAKVFAFR